MSVHSHVSFFVSTRDGRCVYSDDFSLCPARDAIRFYLDFIKKNPTQIVELNMRVDVVAIGLEQTTFHRTLSKYTPVPNSYGIISSEQPALDQIQVELSMEVPQ
jgi:hypothetical protein